MARKRLKKLLGQRLTFVGRFVRYGIKYGFGYPVRTLLFDPVLDCDQVDILTAHIWMTCGKQFAELGRLKKGCLVKFDARVTTYIKGYTGDRLEVRVEKPVLLDYHLVRPSRVVKLTAGPTEPFDNWSAGEIPEAPGDD